MSPDVLAQAFEPLFSTRAHGVGLGLPFVKQVVERHGGELDVDSVEGEGTAVVIRLPAKRTAPEPSPESLD